MKRTVAFALGLLACAVGCAPRPQAPPAARSLREQRRQQTLTVPVWNLDVVEELTDNATLYARKTVVVRRAYLDPQRPPRAVGDTMRFPLRGGGAAVLATASVPAWLRTWTGAPVTLRAAVHPPRRDAEGRVAEELLLRGQSIDFAHPLELTHAVISKGYALTIQVENFRGEPATADVEFRLGALRHRTRIGPIEPGAVHKESAPFMPSELRGQLEPRTVTLSFEDGSSVSIDLADWLREPAEGLLDWGYRHTGTSTAVVALSRDVREAELERVAGLELRSFLHQFTDANIEPREPDEPGALPTLPLLVAGTATHNPMAAALIEAAGLAARIEAAGPEGYVLKSLRHGGRPALLVTAQTPRGVMSGVHGLLMRYGVRLSLTSARLPAKGAFRVLDIDEATAPLFARRRLVAVGSEPQWTARWAQADWLGMFDAAARNRFNEVVVPLDGLEATFAAEPASSRDAVFPFDIGAYACVAEARRAHERMLSLLADVARRRGLVLTFARHDERGQLRRAAPPACLGWKAAGVGQPIDVLRDPGDLLSLPRVADTAAAVAASVDREGAVLSVPYGRGARFRAGFLAQFAWDRALTPAAFYRGWADTVVEGAEAEQLAKVLAGIDAIDGELIEAAPQPFGTGPALVLPAEAGDLACEWAALQRRAKAPEMAAQLDRLKAQIQRLRAVQRKLDPIYAEMHEALGGVTAPWDDPMFETASAARRVDLITMRAYMLRALLGALASVQEGALAYHTGLSEPAEALSHLHGALTKWRKARRILLWIGRSDRWTAVEPTLAGLAGRLEGQSRLLAEWLGPAAEGEPSVRLRAQGSDAIIHLFRTPERNVYAVYRLEGQETAQLRLNAAEARLFCRGSPAATIRASGGAFLVSIDTMPRYIVTRRAALPGQPLP